VVLFVITVACALRGVTRSDPRLGYRVALGAVLCHAFVNYLFYNAALAIAVGITAALAWPLAARGAHQAARPAGMLAGVVLAGATLGVAVLALDVVINAAYQRSTRVPFIADLRTDPDRMLRFSTGVQSLNGRRAMPVLGEALLRARSLERDRALGNEPPPAALARTLDAYRRALALDVLNPIVYLEMWRFVSARPDLAQVLREGEQPLELLLTAIALNPGFTPAIDVAVGTMVANGEQAAAVAFLERQVVPWLELIWRQNPKDYERLVQGMEVLSERAPASGLAAALAAGREHVEGLFLDRSQVWFRG
jgi:hypothetical protein